MTDRQIQAIVDTLQEQRNGALNTIVQIQSERAALQEQFETLQKQLDEVKAELNKQLKTEELPEATVA